LAPDDRQEINGKKGNEESEGSSERRQKEGCSKTCKKGRSPQSLKEMTCAVASPIATDGQNWSGCPA